MSRSDENYSEVVGLFHSTEGLEKAIGDLTSSGWDHAELSLLAQRDILRPEHHVEEDTEQLADNPEAGRQAPISESDVRQGRTLISGTAGVAAAFAASGATIMTGGGALAAIIGAAVAGGGAGLLAETLGHQAHSLRERFLKEQIDQGGILLWAKIDTPEYERKARDIFKRCGATDIHMHGQPD